MTEQSEAIEENAPWRESKSIVYHYAAHAFVIAALVILEACLITIWLLITMGVRHVSHFCRAHEAQEWAIVAVEYFTPWVTAILIVTHQVWLLLRVIRGTPKHRA